MKFNAKKGKLVTLFAKAYFGFSLTVLGCVLLVFWASDRYYDHMLLTPDMDAAAEDVHMISREYEGMFQILGPKDTEELIRLLKKLSKFQG